MLEYCHCPAVLIAVAAVAVDVIVMAVAVVVSQQILRMFVILLLWTEAVETLAVSSNLRRLERQCIQTEVACVKEREVFVKYSSKRGRGVLNPANRSYVGSNKKGKREREKEKEKKETRINIYSNIWAVTFTLL